MGMWKRQIVCNSSIWIFARRSVTIHYNNTALYSQWADVSRVWRMRLLPFVARRREMQPPSPGFGLCHDEPLQGAPSGTARSSQTSVGSLSLDACRFGANACWEGWNAFVLLLIVVLIMDRRVPAHEEGENHDARYNQTESVRTWGESSR